MAKKQQPQKELPKELQALKKKIDKFSGAVVKKFEQYILGVALLPPKKEDPKKVNLLVLVDDSDSKKMTKQELKTELGRVMQEIATKEDKQFIVETWILSELWGDCHDGKYDKLRVLAQAEPFMDRGILGACKISEVHKSKALAKFERYIVCYAAVGALFRGEGTEKSDIDVFVVIDDTDVKKMTRGELKDRLTGIMYDMAWRAAEETGVKRKLHIQTYLLTDFWDNIKEANPVIFTFLRDGIPFFDRGMYVPWKQLLKMGKVKPSAESIDLFQNSGEEFMKRAKNKFLHAGVEDAYYAILNPSQAALMMYGLSPGTPRETARLIREIFVEKEKILEKEYADIIQEQVGIWKKYEYEEIKEMSGTEADRLIKNVAKYLKRIKELYEQIEKQKLEETLQHAHDSVTTALRDVLKLDGIHKVPADKLLSSFDKNIVGTKKLKKEYSTNAKKILEAQKLYKKGKLAKPEVEKIRQKTNQFMRGIVEYMEHKRANDLKKAKIMVKYQDKLAEVIVFEKQAFIVHSVNDKDSPISKGSYSPEKGLSKVDKSTIEELEKSLGSEKFGTKVHLHAQTFEALSSLFGAPVEVLLGN